MIKTALAKNASNNGRIDETKSFFKIFVYLSRKIFPLMGKVMKMRAKILYRKINTSDIYPRITTILSEVLIGLVLAAFN